MIQIRNIAQREQTDRDPDQIDGTDRQIDHDPDQIYRTDRLERL